MHQSVLMEEVLQYLQPKPGQCLVDLTLGAGGHAESLLERLGEKGALFGFDKDERALKLAAKRLERFGGRAVIIGKDFREAVKEFKKLGIRSVDGMLMDLGVSSMQLDEADRGFSFGKPGPLDMRMDNRLALTADEIVNRWPAKKLEQILFIYGQERFAKRIVGRIVEERQGAPIQTTTRLAEIIAHAVPSFYRHGRLHPATRTFQALRIVVNDELEALRDFLAEASDYLSEGGRIAVICFQSMEDQIVKQAFRQYVKAGQGRILTKKAVVPQDAEIGRNPRSRSARLRVFEKKTSVASEGRA